MAVLVAVTSSLVTVGILELLRADRPGRQAALAVAPAHAPANEPAPREEQPFVPAASVSESLTDFGERLAVLERRLAALELDSRSDLAATSPGADERPMQNDMRELVLGWVAEDREARRQAEKLKGEEERLSEMEFGARHQALMLAQEHGLAKWQEDRFAELFLETAMKAEEIEKTIDLQSDDPAEVEARWGEFDEWCDERERELTAQLDADLYDKIYGDE